MVFFDGMPAQEVLSIVL